MVVPKHTSQPTTPTTRQAMCRTEVPCFPQKLCKKEYFGRVGVGSFSPFSPACPRFCFVFFWGVSIELRFLGRSEEPKNHPGSPQTIKDLAFFKQTWLLYVKTLFFMGFRAAGPIKTHSLPLPPPPPPAPAWVKEATDTAKAESAKNMNSSTKIRSGKFTSEPDPFEPSLMDNKDKN